MEKVPRPSYVVTPGPSHVFNAPLGSVHTHTRAGGPLRPERAARYATDLGYVSSAGVHTLRISTPSVEIDITADTLPGMQIAPFPGQCPHEAMSFPMHSTMVHVDHKQHSLSTCKRPALCPRPGCEIVLTKAETLEIEEDVLTPRRLTYAEYLEGSSD